MTKEEVYELVKKELGGFLGEPTKIIKDISEVLRKTGLSIGELEYTYQKLFREYREDDSNLARQSWVSASGNFFEEVVRDNINDTLNSEGILAIKGDRIKNRENAREIVGFLTLRAYRRCTQTLTGVWPDSDILLITRDISSRLKVFALLNCKTSDHSRNDSVLFWALALRDNNIRYCLITQDRDNKFKKGHESDQLSGFRIKCEAYLDRVYSTNQFTTECAQVKKIDFAIANGADSLYDDLRLWRKDVVPDFDKTAINAGVFN